MGEAKQRGSRKERASSPKGRMLTGRFKRKRKVVGPRDRFIFGGRTYYKNKHGQILRLTPKRERVIMQDLYAAEQRATKKLEDEYRRAHVKDEL